MPHTIDLNADLGEGCGDDGALLGVVTSANVACGAHAGDAASMRSVCEQAVAGGVVIGAHVSYADRESFGRVAQDVEPDVLEAQMREQVAALGRAASAAGGAVAYVKPHGALYHRVAADDAQARALVRAMLAVGGSAPGLEPRLALLGMPGSLAGKLAQAAGLPVATEAFADRAYLADGSLAPRTQPGAVLEDSDAVVERALAVAQGRVIAAVGGEPLRVDARSLCLHGDTPGAAELAVRVREALEDAGVSVEAFAGKQAS